MIMIIIHSEIINEVNWLFLKVLNPVVAQGQKCVTVNATGFGFDSHSTNCNI